VVLRSWCSEPYHAAIALRRQPAIWKASHAGKPAELVVTQHYNLGESIANPYGPNGRAALAMMKLA